MIQFLKNLVHVHADLLPLQYSNVCLSREWAGLYSWLDGGWGICLCMWKLVKEVALKILNNGRVYITRSVIMPFFPVDADHRVIMESQCIYTGYHSLSKPDQCLKVMLWYYFVTFHNQSLNHLKLFDLTSPSKLMTNLKTPWAAGCWGPKFTTRFWISVSPCLFKAESEGNSGK